MEYVAYKVSEKQTKMMNYRGNKKGGGVDNGQRHRSRAWPAMTRPLFRASFFFPHRLGIDFSSFPSFALFSIKVGRREGTTVRVDNSLTGPVLRFARRRRRRPSPRRVEIYQ